MNGKANRFIMYLKSVAVSAALCNDLKEKTLRENGVNDYENQMILAIFSPDSNSLSFFA